MKTPAEAREALKKALLSGEYQQCVGVLEKFSEVTNQTYNCCLGVACREYMKDGGKILTENINNKIFFISEESDRGFTTLPLAVMDWLGFATVDGVFQKPIHYKEMSLKSLISANDSGMSFEEIAELIDEVILA